jgi:hypothetical protein
VSSVTVVPLVMEYAMQEKTPQSVATGMVIASESLMEAAQSLLNLAPSLPAPY